MSTFSKSMPSLKKVPFLHVNQSDIRTAATNTTGLLAMIVRILTCLWSISVFTVSVISEIDKRILFGSHA